MTHCRNALSIMHGLVSMRCGAGRACASSVTEWSVAAGSTQKSMQSCQGGAHHAAQASTFSLDYGSFFACQSPVRPLVRQSLVDHCPITEAATTAPDSGLSWHFNVGRRCKVWQWEEQTNPEPRRLVPYCTDHPT